MIGCPRTLLESVDRLHVQIDLTPEGGKPINHDGAITVKCDRRSHGAGDVAKSRHLAHEVQPDCFVWTGVDLDPMTPTVGRGGELVIGSQTRSPYLVGPDEIFESALGFHDRPRPAHSLEPDRERSEVDESWTPVAL